MKAKIITVLFVMGAYTGCMTAADLIGKPCLNPGDCSDAGITYVEEEQEGIDIPPVVVNQ